MVLRCSKMLNMPRLLPLSGFVILLLASGLASRDCAKSAQAAPLASKLETRIPAYDLGPIGFLGALMQVSKDFEVPMGIVWVNSAATRKPLRLSCKDKTVQEILSAVVQTQPGYRVAPDDGIVHVFPEGLIPQKEDLLTIKVENFETDNTILELALFKLHMLVNPIRGSFQLSVAGPGDSKVSLELKDVTVQNILDALAVASNRKIWIVTYSLGAGKTPRGFRRTSSLFTDLEVPDNQQPIWYFHRWGDPLPPAALPPVE